MWTEEATSLNGRPWSRSAIAGKSWLGWMWMRRKMDRFDVVYWCFGWDDRTPLRPWPYVQHRLCSRPEAGRRVWASSVTVVWLGLRRERIVATLAAGSHHEVPKD